MLTLMKCHKMWLFNFVAFHLVLHCLPNHLFMGFHLRVSNSLDTDDHRSRLTFCRACACKVDRQMIKVAISR